PEYEELCNGTAPEPVMMDLYGGDMSLTCSRAETTPANLYPLIGGVVIACTVAALVVYGYRRRRT
ncbi:MAG: hypothetical protein ACOC38_11550, partial [Promethearchaeia archaeon]